MSDNLVKIPAEAKEIIKHKRSGKIYATKADFDADVADPNTDTTQEDFRQDLEIKVTKVSMGAATKK
jgi:parvulin-like peptidyl-prolyl isomerase